MRPGTEATAAGSGLKRIVTLSTLNRDGLDELERICREWLTIS